MEKLRAELLTLRTDPTPAASSKSVTASFQIQTPDFSITATPGSLTIPQGSSSGYTIGISPISGFTGNVALSVIGLPTGATGSFNPSSISGGSGSSTLTVAPSRAALPGTYTLIITGTSGSLTHSTTVTLIVQERLILTITVVGNGYVRNRNSNTICTSTCVYYFPRNYLADLGAFPRSGSVFTGWSGSACSQNPLSRDCTFHLTTDTSLTATFNP